jgi:hypothetical protein
MVRDSELQRNQQNLEKSPKIMKKCQKCSKSRQNGVNLGTFWHILNDYSDDI